MENVSARGAFGKHHKKGTSVNHKGERKIIIKKQSARKAHYGGFLLLNVNALKGNSVYK